MWRTNAFIVALILALCLYAGLAEEGTERGAPSPLTPQGTSAPAVETASFRKPLPSFTFRTWESATDTESASLKGHPVLINVWASWCAPCLAEFPALLKVAAQYKSEGLVILAVSVDHDARALRRFLKERQAEYPALFPQPNFLIVTDSTRRLSQDVFQTLRYPETLLVGRDHTLRGKIIGGDANWQGADIQARIQALLE